MPRLSMLLPLMALAAGTALAETGEGCEKPQLPCPETRNDPLHPMTVECWHYGVRVVAERDVIAYHRGRCWILMHKKDRTLVEVLLDPAAQGFVCSLRTMVD